MQLARKVADSSAFQRFVMLVIVAAGILVGIETYPSMVAEHGGILHALDKIILGIFVVEILVKLAASMPKPWRYFTDGWNVFDFTIVAVCFMPFDGGYVTVLRLLRLLRVLRLVHALPKLQILVNALLKSIPSMGYVAMFLGLLFYVYGVTGVFLFGGNDPLHFGSLQKAVLTLFTVVTLEGWADLLNVQMYGCDKFSFGMDALCTQPSAHPAAAPAYFVTFVLFGTMIVLNLFIGIIMNSMQEARDESENAEEEKRVAARGEAPPTIEHEVHLLGQSAQALAERVEHLQRRLVGGQELKKTS